MKWQIERVEARGFVHKRFKRAIGGAFSSLVQGGNPIVGAGRAFVGGGGNTAPPPPELATSTGGAFPKGFFGGKTRADRGGCPSGMQMFPDGHCHRRAAALLLHPQAAVAQGALPGGDEFTSFDDGGGAAVMGRYGRAMAPVIRMAETRDCLPGMVLGDDNLCYDTGKGGITNKQRKYPRGTRPLGTPGEMAALNKAAKFGKRMETTVKKMQKIGVLKKPHTHRKAAPKMKRLAPGGTSIINVE